MGSNLNYFISLFRCKYNALHTFLQILCAVKYPPPSQQEYIKLISGSDPRMFPLSPVPFALVRLQVKGERGTET